MSCPHLQWKRKICVHCRPGRPTQKAAACCERDETASGNACSSQRLANKLRLRAQSWCRNWLKTVCEGISVFQQHQCCLTHHQQIWRVTSTAEIVQQPKRVTCHAIFGRNQHSKFQNHCFQQKSPTIPTAARKISSSECFQKRVSSHFIRHLIPVSFVLSSHTVVQIIRWRFFKAHYETHFPLEQLFCELFI